MEKLNRLRDELEVLDNAIDIITTEKKEWCQGGGSVDANQGCALEILLAAAGQDGVPWSDTKRHHLPVQDATRRVGAVMLNRLGLLPTAYAKHYQGVSPDEIVWAFNDDLPKEQGRDIITAIFRRARKNVKLALKRAL